jgi:amino acid adenylation domain-containing protein
MSATRAARRDDRIPPRPDRGMARLSFSQQRLWFLHKLEPDSPAYNISAIWPLDGPLHVQALEAALDEVVRRHEALRACFTTVDGEAVQVIRPAVTVPLRIEDLGSVADAKRKAEATRLADAEAEMPFDLATGPPLRATLVRLGPQRHRLLLTVHHIVADGWSMEILFEEIGALYGAYARGQRPTLPQPPIQFGDFAEWQRDWMSGERLKRLLEHWTHELEGAVPLLDLPVDRPRPQVKTFSGAGESFTVPAMVMRELHALARRENATLFMTLLAAFDVLLFRHSGQTDVLVGSPIANRARPELERVVGFFANTLVLRANLGSDPSFRELLARVRAVTLRAYANQDLPFERLVEALDPVRTLSHNPVFQVMLTLQQAAAPRPGAIAANGGASTSVAAPGLVTSKFDLTLLTAETPDGLSGLFEYDSALFDRATVLGIIEHFQTLLAQIAADPDARLSSFRLHSDEEREEIVRAARGDEPERGSVRPVTELLARCVAAAPDALAIDAGGEQLSYRELDTRAEALADRLRALGVGPDGVVAIELRRSPELVVAMLAVLKAGGAYLPLDPDYPRERRAFMVAVADVRALVTERSLDTAMLAPRDVTIHLDAPGPPPAPAATPAPAPQPDQLAYVLYTSGSTGRPKGVAMRHGPLANLIAWMERTASGRAGARTLQLTSASFDVAFQEIFGTLCTGGTLVIDHELDRRDPESTWRTIVDARVERLFVTPSFLAQLAEAAAGAVASDLREIVTAGEPLRITPEIAALLERRPGCVLRNQYGPTETHVVTDHVVAPGDGPLPPIGRPVAGVTVHVLDEWLRPVPYGVRGELCVGGAALARGYLGRAGQTAERFVPDPLGPPGARLYRTGDVVRRRRDGELEFVGRLDDQVKVRGFRVELAEVESVIAEHPSIRDAAVVLREHAPGDQRLIAYVVPAPGGPGALEAFLRRRLPEHMLPSRIVELDSIPLNANGKLDRRALPELDGARPELREPYVAPRGPLESELAELFEEVLGIERVGVHDDFFQLGGHSLLATRMASRMRERFSVDVPLRSLFEQPTVAGLSTLVVQAQAEAAAELSDGDTLESLLTELEALPTESARATLTTEPEA